MISCASWLLFKNKTITSSLVLALLQFCKKLYCVERSFSSPQEYYSALQVYLSAASLLTEPQALSSYLNVVFAAVEMPESDFLPALEAACFNVELTHQGASHLFTWLGSRLEMLLGKRVAPDDMEHLAKQHVQFHEAAEFLEKLQPHLGVPNEPSLGDKICAALSENFEQGILMLRQLEDNEECDSQVKQQLFEKLLALVLLPSNTQEQKVQQAYSLKALQWMKQTLFGIEETFKTTPELMRRYAQAQ